MASKILPLLTNFSTKIQKVEVATEYFLTDHEAFDNKSAIFGINIFNAVRILYPPSDSWEKNTFLQYLSIISRNENSRITCEGKRQGYYLRDVENDTVGTSNEITQSIDEEGEGIGLSDEPATKYNQKEKHLYPILVDWLRERGYWAQDISTNKALGKWGNPDVAGINTNSNLFGGHSIEIATIEAKVTKCDWEKLIFEAVSHRRFSNRAYFAFAHPAEFYLKLPLSKMRKYGELFKVGILVILIPGDQLKNLDTAIEDDDQTDIIEIISAPLIYVSPEYQTAFCRAQGVNNSQDLFRWGKKPAEESLELLEKEKLISK